MNYENDTLIELAKKEYRLRSMFLVVMKFSQPQTLLYRTLIFPEKKFIFNRIFEQNVHSKDGIKNNKSIIVADITFDKNDHNFSNEKEILEKQRNNF